MICGACYVRQGCVHWNICSSFLGCKSRFSLTQPNSHHSLYTSANSQTGGSSVDCFTSTDCTGTPVVDASVTDARTCCIGNGFSYDAMDGSGCQICNGMAGST